MSPARLLLCARHRCWLGHARGASLPQVVCVCICANLVVGAQLHPDVLPAPHPAASLQVCHGSGVETKLRPLGPGMVQQIQQRCSRCGGGGYSCPPSDRCAQCDGKGLSPEKKVFEVRRCGARLSDGLERHLAAAAASSEQTLQLLPLNPRSSSFSRVCPARCWPPLALCTSPPRPLNRPQPAPPALQVHIEPGHRHGSKVVFRGEAGSDSPDVLPGDLIFILEQVGGGWVEGCGGLVCVFGWGAWPKWGDGCETSTACVGWLPSGQHGPSVVGAGPCLARAPLDTSTHTGAGVSLRCRRKSTAPSSASAPTCSTRRAWAWWTPCAAHISTCPTWMTAFWRWPRMASSSPSPGCASR